MTDKVLRVLEADPSGDWAEGGKAAGSGGGQILGEPFGPSGQWAAGEILGAAGEIAGEVAGSIYGGLKDLANSTLHPVEFAPAGSGEGDPGAGMSGPQGGTSVDPNANEHLQSGGD